MKTMKLYIVYLCLVVCSSALPHRQQRSVDDLTNFFESLRGYVGEVGGQIQSLDNSHRLYRAISSGEAFLESLNIFNNWLYEILQTAYPNAGSDIVSYDSYEHCLNIQSELSNLLALLQEAVRHAETPAFEDTGNGVSGPQEFATRSVGRPYIEISREQIELLHGLGFSWVGIANILGVSARTLRNRRHELQMPFGQNTYSELTDGELDRHIEEVLELFPRAGQTMLFGALRQRGLHLQRQRIRESIIRVNPIATALRRRYRLQRRQYNVRLPNALWHLDGNHKLIHWRMVVHGAIDGYSRTIVYLRCHSNNRASSVMGCFIEAMNTYGLPSRVRTDYGMENIEVGRYMIQTRGVGRGSIIAGRSVHNQRIERLWRDVNIAVLETFRNIFFFLEDSSVLQRDSELHLFALQYTFMPRINRALEEFRAMWNNHVLRTERRSPLQMFYSGILTTNVDLHPANVSMYGVEEEGLPGEIRTNNDVNIPSVQVDISDEVMNQLNESVDVLANDGNNGVNIYTRVLEIAEECLQVGS